VVGAAGAGISRGLYAGGAGVYLIQQPCAVDVEGALATGLDAHEHLAEGVLRVHQEEATLAVLGHAVEVVVHIIIKRPSSRACCATRDGDAGEAVPQVIAVAGVASPGACGGRSGCWNIRKR
jgi:hypothetical protein